LVVLRPIGVENIGIALDNDVAFGTDADLGLAFYFIGVDAGVIGRQGRLAAAFDFGGFGRLGIFVVAKQASAAQGKRIGFALSGFCRFGFGGGGRGRGQGYSLPPAEQKHLPRARLLRQSP